MLDHGFLLGGHLVVLEWLEAVAHQNQTAGIGSLSPHDHAAENYGTENLKTHDGPPRKTFSILRLRRCPDAARDGRPARLGFRAPAWCAGLSDECTVGELSHSRGSSHAGWETGSRRGVPPHGRWQAGFFGPMDHADQARRQRQLPRL